jgi:hypothetical protein
MLEIGKETGGFGFTRLIHPIGLRLPVPVCFMGYPTTLPAQMVIPIVKEFRFFLTGGFLIKKPRLILGQLFLLLGKKYDL